MQTGAKLRARRKGSDTKNGLHIVDRRGEGKDAKEYLRRGGNASGEGKGNSDGKGKEPTAYPPSTSRG